MFHSQARGGAQHFGDVWECTASSCALSPLPAICRRTRRVQREVHVQPNGAAWWVLRHADRARARELP
jgi:hypothetical protein